MTHGHFLQMGGFKICCTPEENSHGQRKETNKSCHQGIPIIDQRYFDVSYAESKKSKLLSGFLSFDAFKILLNEGLITLPAIDKEDIDDKGKGDALSKGIAFLQLLWFVVQIIARAREGLAITGLELTTAALAGLNSVMYIFWWDKPLSVQRPIVIYTKRAQEIIAQSDEKPIKFHREREFSVWEHCRGTTSDLCLYINKSDTHFIIAFRENLRWR